VITRKAYGGAYDVMAQQAHPRRHQPRLADGRDRRDGRRGRGQHHLPRELDKIADDPVAEKAEVHRRVQGGVREPVQGRALGYVDEVIR
jgi:acetyl-CoA carboxylase carboxyltransferase component